MQYLKRSLTPVQGVVEVSFEETPQDVLFRCDPYIADTICYTWNNQKKILNGRRANQTRQEVHTCVICGANFTDPFEHMENHEGYIDKAKKSGYIDPCICGSEVKRYEYMGGGWERSCDTCKMVYDSDLRQQKLWDSLQKDGENTNSGSRATMEEKSQLMPGHSSMSGAELLV